MSDQTQQTVADFKRWLDQVVACGDWRAESDFIAPNFIVHSHTGTKRYSREEWIDGRGSGHCDATRRLSPRALWRGVTGSFEGF